MHSTPESSPKPTTCSSVAQNGAARPTGFGVHHRQPARDVAQTSGDAERLAQVGASPWQTSVASPAACSAVTQYHGLSPSCAHHRQPAAMQALSSRGAKRFTAATHERERKETSTKRHEVSEKPIGYNAFFTALARSQRASLRVQ